MLHNRINKSLTTFEVLFCVYGFLFYTGVWWAFTGQSLALLTSLIRYSILAISLAFLLLRWKTSVQILPKGGFLWLLFGLCVVSFFWSSYPGLTVQGIVRNLLQISLFGLYFSSRFNPKDQLYIIALAMSITLIVNLFYVIALPSIGLHVGDKFAGAWKGFYTNKNEFSGTIIWSLIVFYVLSFKDSNRVAMRLARLGLLICPYFLLRSTSKTALVVFIFLYFSLTIWKRYRWQGKRTILTFDVLLLSSVFLASSVMHNWAGLVSGLGKDPTLSGRTLIWSGAFFDISQRPILGYGFSAFWTEANPAARGIGDALYPGFYTYNSHNGFLDILLAIGWLGLVLFSVGFLSTWALAFKYAYNPKSPEDSWPLAVMLLITSYNITESSFLAENINWLFYVLAYFSLRIWPRRLNPKGKGTYKEAEQL